MKSLFGLNIDSQFAIKTSQARSKMKEVVEDQESVLKMRFSSDLAQHPAASFGCQIHFFTSKKLQ